MRGWKVSFYPSAANDTRTVNSVGVKATLVTSASLSDDVVYAITKEVLDNFEAFRALRPTRILQECECPEINIRTS